MNQTTTVSLFEMLTTLWLYPFPHLALFILVAIPIEIFCLSKKGSKRITASIVTLSTASVLIAIYWSFTISSRSYTQGEHIQITVLYPISCLALAASSVVLYSAGLRREIKDGKKGISFIRAPLFLGIICLFSLSAFAPYRANRMLQDMQTKTQNQSEVSTPFARASLTP